MISPGTTQLSSKDLEYRIEVSEAVAVIADADNAHKFDAIGVDHPALKRKIVSGAVREGWIHYEQALNDANDDFEAESTDADDVAMCYFTSGTTGHPKGVVYSHRSTVLHSYGTTSGCVERTRPSRAGNRPSPWLVPDRSADAS